jgi:hypothetical protein
LITKGNSHPIHPLFRLQAQAKYAEMRRLDAAALEATQALGCPSCAQAAAAAAASRADAQQQQQQPGSVQLYQQLHMPSAWPAAAASAGMVN